MRKLLLPALAALASAVAGHAQSLPILDQNPPALRWQQVSTPHFRVLYPAGLEEAAQRTATRLEQVYGPGAATLSVSPRPISVVMQTRTSVSNGFVTFLPRHAEFFITPQQGMGLGTVDWLDGLVVHEYRHVGQFEKGRQGIGRFLSPLLGDGALGVAAVGVPQWFFEGDAVGTETALTRSGRGRIPEFGVGLRANLLSGRFYNYQKAANGSLRDQVPNWYVLGYYLTSYAKAHYGPDVWDRALTRYYRFPFYPFSFSDGLKRTTGLRVEDLYQRTVQELDSTWRAEQRTLQLTEAQELAGQYQGKVFTEYQYPQYVNDSTVLALKSGLGDIAQLVLLDRRGTERKIHVPGLLNLPELLSVGGGKAVWPELQPDARWGQRIYSELRVLNLQTRRVARLGRHHRYTAAALSPNGQRLVAVETDTAYHHALHLLDAGTGAVLQTLPNPQNDLYLQPRFLPDGQHIAAVVLKPGGKTIEVLEPATGTTRPLLPVANINLTNPQPWGDYVLYNSPQSGIDNIYAVHVTTGQVFQVTSRPLGAYQAAVSPDGQRLAFHDYRATGARVVEMPLNPAAWQPVPAAPADAVQPYAAALAAREPGAAAVVPLLGVASRQDSVARYPMRPYSVLRNAFNVFSWGVVQSPTGNSVSLGVRSQDVLSTTQAIAGVSYDQNERTAAVFGGFSYQGQYPVLDAEISHGGRDVTIRRNGALLRDQWQATRLTTGLRLPLTLTRSRMLSALTLSSYYLHERVSGYDLPVRFRSEPGPDQPVHALQTTLSYVAQLKQSARDVAPCLGGTLLLTSRLTPFRTGLDARQWGAQGSVFLPGLAKHHALRLRAGYQYQQQSQYQFASAVSFPRGEGYVSFDRLRAASVDYYLPLAFPHWSVGRVLYVQRLRATTFLDVAQGRSAGISGAGNYRNVGLDVAALFNVLRLRTPLEAGLRLVVNTYTNELILEPLAFSIRL
ncbi:hypothetical protein [Hymenobacter sediminicola]|uniref:PD40 domain-containing protein n=1 Tax=Hymenobacter sediminicola TaxID=2761579 RepID=A0A7G7W8K9_9BACT|nr:hypothetical protein [Hymenobacter sediminicola]QNH62702.1 hypothetical protein H4317_02425 [Hymenobacter sediminicola]